MEISTDKEREKLYGLLGDLPSREREISVEKISEKECPGYILETLVLDLNGIEPVPAFFVKPKNTDGKIPGILFNHCHGGMYQLGKNELLDGPGSYSLNEPYADALTRMGYGALCIDAWAFGDRRGRKETELFKQMLWNGQVMWGMMVYDNLRALDYLASRPELDSNRLGTTGLSMGSTMAWWTAALDTRIKVCTDLCCMTDFHTLIERRGLDGHGIYYYVPGLLKKFTTASINALIAPRPHLSINGIFDPLTPPDGLDVIDKELKKIYAEKNAPGAWQLKRYHTGHYETPAMRKEILAFFKQWL